MHPSLGSIMIAVALMLIVSSSPGHSREWFGSKVNNTNTTINPDFSRTLVPFDPQPRFAFVDLSSPNSLPDLPDPNNPVYLHISLANRVSFHIKKLKVEMDDIRLTCLGDKNHQEVMSNAKAMILMMIGSDRLRSLELHYVRYPAELGYCDQDGSGDYSLDDSVYLQFHQERLDLAT